MKLGINASEIMQRDFPIVDSSLKIHSCAYNLDEEHEACLVLRKGNCYNVLGYQEIVRNLFKRDRRIEKMGLRHNFRVINEGADLSKIIRLLKKKVDFLVVKNSEGRVVGLITERELAEAESRVMEKLAVTL